MKPTTITRSEWLQAIEQASVVEDDPSMVSIKEYAALMGCHENSARRQLRLLENKGFAVRGSKAIRDPMGIRRIVPAYRLKNPR